MRSMDDFESEVARWASATAATASTHPLPADGTGIARCAGGSIDERWTADVEEAWSLAYNLTAGRCCSARWAW
jgi:hypothetical protein